MNRLHRWICASSPWRHAIEERILPWVLDGVSLGESILEVGPGPGLTTDALRSRAQCVTAVEIDGNLAAALGKRLSGTNVRVVRGDGSKMPFAGDTFSSAVSFTMLHHVPSRALQDELFGEVRRVLRPGAWFAGTDSTASLAFRLAHLGDTMVMVEPETLAGRLEASGFVHVRVERATGRFRFHARKAPDS